MSLWPSRPCRGDRVPSELADVGRERTSSTSMLSPPPPPSALSECLFFFGVFLSMLARAAGP